VVAAPPAPTIKNSNLGQVKFGNLGILLHCSEGFAVQSELFIQEKLAAIDRHVENEHRPTFFYELKSKARARVYLILVRTDEPFALQLCLTAESDGSPFLY
jgi:hypothetical protein